MGGGLRSLDNVQSLEVFFYGFPKDFTFKIFFPNSSYFQGNPNHCNNNDGKKFKENKFLTQTYTG